MMRTSISRSAESAISFWPRDTAYSVPSTSTTATPQNGSWRTPRGAFGMFKPREKSLWSNPELSVGRLCPSNCSPSVGQCWEAVGPAAEAYNKIAEQIATLFQNQSEHLDEGEEQAWTFSYGLWMVGPSKDLARPTIILACQSSSVRKRAKKVLEESNLLSPGMVIKTTPKTPVRFASTGGSSGDILSDDIISREENTLWGAVVDQDRCTTRVVLGNSNYKQYKSASEATMGKYVLVDGVAYGLTVSHLFSREDSSVELANDQTELIFDEDTDDDSAGIDTTLNSLSRFLPGRGSRVQDHSDAKADCFSDVLQEVSPDPEDEHMLSQDNFFSDVKPSPLTSFSSADKFVEVGTLSARSNEFGADWALISLESKAWKSRNRIMLPYDPGVTGNTAQQFVLCENIVPSIDSSPAIVATGNAPAINAYVSSTPTYTRFQHTKTFTKTWPLQTARPLELGDCGSWIVHPDTGDFYGHVIAANLGSCLSYFVAAKDIFSEVSLSHGCTISLPPRELEPIPKTKAIAGKLSLSVSQVRWLGSTRALALVATVEKNEYISPNLLELESEGEDSQQRELSQVGMPEAAFIRLARRASRSQDGKSPFIRTPSTRVSNRNLECQVNFDITVKPITIDLSLHDTRDGWAVIAQTRLQEDPQHCTGVPKWLELYTEKPDGHVTAANVLISLYFDHRPDPQQEEEGFEILESMGKGDRGQVFKIRKTDTQRLYAMEVTTRKDKESIPSQAADIINSVSPFVAIPKFSVEFLTDSYIRVDGLCVDYPSGGQLLWHLQRVGRFSEEQARFYLAEILCGLKAYYDLGLVYGFLKPENMVLNARGHIVLTSFQPLMTGSRVNIDKQAVSVLDYAAPEMLHHGAKLHGSTIFWSLGVVLFEMICGWNPFYSEDPRQWRKNILSAKARLPRSVMSAKGRSFAKGLFIRNPEHRLGVTNGAEDLMVHPWLAELAWEQFWRGMVQPPFQPPLHEDVPELFDNGNSPDGSAAALAPQDTDVSYENYSLRSIILSGPSLKASSAISSERSMFPFVARSMRTPASLIPHERPFRKRWT